ncbi:ferric reductase-like transmembrane domain-containing protein [Cognatishimia sp. F0-27]|uniref:ferric reductase-like transmembrane domain-containing protein n=1 Tax=Cognatishimia sp. F0-27 TaxID=2816855 RepID=UPI001D0C4069|nr:ferric reductase-like transmembrane domain-containing protein [Cognatishimia sp. F0-27]MCC1491987.1 ferric reductase-like transmembrane domain-containing protein [Cognatishimia sp. F0-27]
MSRTRSALIWICLTAVLLVPLYAAAASPLLAWRDPVYIVAGFAGVVALSLLVVQPLLILGALPGMRGSRARGAHRWVGIGLMVAVVLHLVGLWITSPPDVVDALLFVSPTPFSAWGVIGMWAVFAGGALALFRGRLKIRYRTWRRAHLTLAVLVVLGSVIHAVQIQGTMETVSKILLCAAALCATAVLLWRVFPKAALRLSRPRTRGP